MREKREDLRGRAFCSEAWELLTVIGLAAGASRDRLSFTPDMKEAMSKADFVQESVPERPLLKAVMQTLIDGVLKEANGQSVEQLAEAENKVVLELLALRAKAGRTLP